MTKREDKLLKRAQLFFNTRQYDSALKIYNKMLQQNAHSVNALRGIAKIYLHQEEPKDIVLYLDTIRMIEKKLGSSEDLGFAFESFGMVCYNHRNYEDALNFFQEAIRIYLLHENFGQIGDLYNMMGDCFLKLKRYDDALQTYRELLTLQHKLNNIQGVVEALETIGDINLEIGDYPVSLNHYHRALDTLNSFEMKDHRGILLYKIGKLLLSQEAHQDAYHYLNEALIIFQKLELLSNEETIFSKDTRALLKSLKEQVRS